LRRLCSRFRRRRRGLPLLQLCAVSRQQRVQRLSGVIRQAAMLQEVYELVDARLQLVQAERAARAGIEAELLQAGAVRGQRYRRFSILRCRLSRYERQHQNRREATHDPLHSHRTTPLQNPASVPLCR
jgi:hypothetical protein